MKSSSRLSSYDTICHSAAIAPISLFDVTQTMDAYNTVLHACCKRYGIKYYYFHGLKNVRCIQETNGY